MRIETIGDLLDFKAVLECEGKGVPENLIIVSPQLIEDALDWVGYDKNVLKTSTGTKIYGINVIRDYAEIY